MVGEMLHDARQTHSVKWQIHTVAVFVEPDFKKAAMWDRSHEDEEVWEITTEK